MTYLGWLRSWSLSLGSQIRHDSLFFASWQSNRTELRSKFKKKWHFLDERGLGGEGEAVEPSGAWVNPVVRGQPGREGVFQNFFFQNNCRFMGSYQKMCNEVPSSLPFPLMLMSYTSRELTPTQPTEHTRVPPISQALIVMCTHVRRVWFCAIVPHTWICVTTVTVKIQNSSRTRLPIVTPLEPVPLSSLTPSNH